MTLICERSTARIVGQATISLRECLIRSLDIDADQDAMAEHRGSHIAIAAETTYVALLPVALFVAYRASPVNQLGFLDPWMYSGLIHNFADLVDRYGLTYFSVRFGLLVPHLVFAEMLGPVPGYLATCYLLGLVAGIPLYVLFRKRYSVEAAVFAYAFLVSSVWLARTILWTHPDAAAVPYILAAVSLLLLDPTPRAPAYFGIGVLFALAANSNIFSITVSGLSASAYVILHAGTLRDRLPRDVMWMVAGFVTVFVVGSIGYFLCCGTPDFLRSTRHMIRWGFSGGGEVFRVPYSRIFGTFDYVFLPLVLGTALALSAVVVRGGERTFAAAAGYFSAVVAFVAWWQFVFQGVFLELFYYFSFLLPPFLLCAALIVVRLSNAAGAEAGRKWLLATTLAVVSAPLLHVYGMLDFSGITRQSYLVINGIALGTMAAGRWVPIALPVGALLFAVAMHTHWNSRDPAQSHASGSPYYRVWDTKSDTELEAYRLAIKVVNAIPKVRDDGKPVWFWYSSSDLLMNSLQSTYLWAYSRLESGDNSTAGMPHPSSTALTRLAVTGEPWLALIDRSMDKIEAGKRALRESGFVLNNVRHSTLCSGSLCIELALATVTSPGSGRPFPGFDNASHPRSASSLITLDAASLEQQVQPKLYGKTRKLQNLLSSMWPSLVPRFAPAQLMPEGYVRFRPTTVRDYLATEFLTPASVEMGGSRDFRLRVEHDLTFTPSPRCRIELQDQEFRALAEFGCSDPSEAGRAEVEKVFRLPGIPEKLRMIIKTGEPGESPLPVRIELAQAVSTGR